MPDTASRSHPDTDNRDIRALFAATSERAYLNTAAEGLQPSSSHLAFERYAELKGQGSRGRPGLYAMQEECRRLAGEVLGVDPSTVAFLASTSRGLDVCLRSIDWSVGDNIVLGPAEFPSAHFAATRLRSEGVEVRQVPADTLAPGPADFAALMDERTRLVVASLVSFKTGAAIDLDALAREVHTGDSLLFVDAVQAAGTMAFDGSVADFVCAATYKWMLAAHGLSILAANPRETSRLRAPYIGYRGVRDLFPAGGPDNFELFEDARRLEEGMPNLLGISLLQESLRLLLDIGLSQIAAHNEALTSRVLSGLQRIGITPLTPIDASHRGSIASFEVSGAESVVEELAGRQIDVWGRDGRLRASTHIYTDAADVDRLLDGLDELIGRR